MRKIILLLLMLGAVTPRSRGSFLTYGENEPQLADCFYFREGFAPIYLNMKYGYISRSGDIVIDPQFADCTFFNSGLAVVVDEKNNHGLIDKSGKFVVKPEKCLIKHVFQDLYFLKPLSGKRTAIMNSRGRILFDFKQVSYIAVKNGMLETGQGSFVNPDQKKLVMGNTEKLVNYTDCFINAPDGVVYIVNINNERISLPEARRGIGLFQEGLGLFMDKTGKYGYVNNQGTIIIKPTFKSANRFREGYAPVKIGEKWGYINRSGTVVIKPRYLWADMFYEGFAVVQSDDAKYGLIDVNGRFVIEPAYDEMNNVSEGIVCVKQSDTAKYIDLTGKVIFQFDAVRETDRMKVAKIEADNRELKQLAQKYKEEDLGIPMDLLKLPLHYDNANCLPLMLFHERLWEGKKTWLKLTEDIWVLSVKKFDLFKTGDQYDFYFQDCSKKRGFMKLLKVTTQIFHVKDKGISEVPKYVVLKIIDDTERNGATRSIR